MFGLWVRYNSTIRLIMNMKRKTIEVDRIRIECIICWLTLGYQKDKRKGIIDILSFILCESGQYNGYRFIDTKAVLDGTGDETQRIYF